MCHLWWCNENVIPLQVAGVWHLNRWLTGSTADRSPWAGGLASLLLNQSAGGSPGWVMVSQPVRAANTTDWVAYKQQAFLSQFCRPAWSGGPLTGCRLLSCLFPCRRGEEVVCGGEFLIRTLIPLWGSHPHDLISSQRPLLTVPSRLKVKMSTYEFGGNTNTQTMAESVKEKDCQTSLHVFIFFSKLSLKVKKEIDLDYRLIWEFTSEAIFLAVTVGSDR